ncbi:MAG TPA: RluA family pseudouridine synthase [Kofleriaceae bacterium]|nr:RluA family pseudouridine synthase [Kofleriaceae bacterium]
MTPTTPSSSPDADDHGSALDGDPGGQAGDADEAGDADGADDDAPSVFALPPGADPALDWGLDAHRNPDGSPRIIERHLAVPPELAGLRLDHFVKTQIPRLSRTRIQAIIADQLRRSDGHAPKPATIVAAGEHYVIRRPAQPEPPCPRTFGVVVRDPRLYVVDKPAGLPVHASAKFYFNTLTRVLAERFPDEPELQICHRLDRETSGCLVVARDRAAAATIKLAFAARDSVTKRYLAVVHGQPPWDTEQTIDLPLRIAQPGDPTKLVHVRMLPGPGGLPAITRVRVEHRAAEYALVRCTLLTGRQHQIRAHLAAAGFPIVGDKLYAHGDDAFLQYCNEGLVPELARRFVLPRHALHAASVAFPHPDGRTITAEAPLPADLARLLD